MIGWRIHRRSNPTPGNPRLVIPGWLPNSYKRSSAIRLNRARAVFTSMCLCIAARSGLASVCVPVLESSTKGPTGFNSVVPIGDIDWVIYPNSVLYVDGHKPPVEYGLRGRVVSSAALDSTLWVGTTAGAQRFTVRQRDPNVAQNFTVTFPAAANEQPGKGYGSEQASTTSVSTAFGRVLFTRVDGVYQLSENNEAVRTSLEAANGNGRAFGERAYWWVTPSAVFSLTETLSATQVWSGSLERTVAEPVATSDHLWLSDATGALVAVPKDGKPTSVPISGTVLSIAKGPSDEVWVSTDKGVFQIVDFVAVPMVPNEGNLRLSRVTRNHLVLRRCGNVSLTPGGTAACAPEMIDRPIGVPSGDSSSKRIAKDVSDITDLNAEQTELYVPTTTGLFMYDLVKSETKKIYERGVNFVRVTSQGIWLGTTLAEQRSRTDDSNSSRPPDSSKALVAHSENLCRFDKTLIESVRVSGQGALSWYLEFGALRMLIGDTLKLVPQVVRLSGQSDAGIPLPSMEICKEKCDTDGQWQRELRVQFTEKSVDGEPVRYWIRQAGFEQSVSGPQQTESFTRLPVLVVPTVTATLLAIVLLLLAPWYQSVRAILFIVFPKSGWAAYFNPFVLLASFFPPLRWWVLRPVLVEAAGSPELATQTDIEVARLCTSNGAHGFVLYDCPQDELTQRSSAVCQIIAAASLKLGRATAKRLPIPVRLAEQSDGNLKGALTRHLERFSLDAEILVEQTFRSGTLIFLLSGCQKLTPDAASTVTRLVNSQLSASVCLNAGGLLPDVLNPVAGSRSSTPLPTPSFDR